MSELALGTVQLGMPYGIANTTGVPDQLAANEMIRAASEGGVRVFDTAQGYGASEQVLGDALRALGATGDACVVTKLHKDVFVEDDEAVAQAVKASLARLGVSRLHGLLLHRDDWREDQLVRLRATVNRDMAERIGVSVYSPERALQAMAMDGVGIVQIPSNVLDRRFERAGVFERARERGVTIYVRSVFLQGLLLMDGDRLLPSMVFARPVLERVDALAQELGVSRHVLALQYVKAAYPDARVIVGAETVEQVCELVTAWKREAPVDIVERVHKAFSDVDECVLDPRKWPLAHLQHLVCAQKPEAADAIVWLQGNEYDRGETALALFEAGYAPRIVVTGNNRRMVDMGTVKVEDMVAWLLERDVNAERIIVDDQSYHTRDQCQFIVKTALACGWSSVLLIASTHHQMRAFLTLVRQSRCLGWEGRVINQPHAYAMDACPTGRFCTTRDALQEEREKMARYADDVASVEEGLECFGNV